MIKLVILSAIMLFSGPVVASGIFDQTSDRQQRYPSIPEIDRPAYRHSNGGIELFLEPHASPNRDGIDFMQPIVSRVSPLIMNNQWLGVWDLCVYVEQLVVREPRDIPLISDGTCEEVARKRWPKRGGTNHRMRTMHHA